MSVWKFGHVLAAKSAYLSHPEYLTVPGGLPGSSGWDTNRRSSRTGKTLRIVQVEEPCLPQARLEHLCCTVR